MTERVPTLYEWIGGMPALVRLTERFYARVRSDATLAPINSQADPARSTRIRRCRNGAGAKWRVRTFPKA